MSNICKYVFQENVYAYLMYVSKGMYISVVWVKYVYICCMLFICVEYVYTYIYICVCVCVCVCVDVYYMC